MLARPFPVSRLLLAAALAYASVLLALALLPSRSAWLLWLMNLTGGVWLAWFFLLAPSLTARTLPRVGAACAGLSVSVALPTMAYLLVLPIMFSLELNPFLARDNLLPDEPAWKSPLYLALLSSPFVLAGLGLGGAGWSIHHTFDPRLGGWRAGWAWLAPAIWGVFVPPVVIIVFMPQALGQGWSIPWLIALVVAATLPHLLAQIVLARRLAATTPVAVASNAHG